MRGWIIGFVLCGSVLFGAVETGPEEYDFSGVESQLEEAGTEASFSELVQALLAGSWKEAGAWIAGSIRDSLFSELVQARGWMLELIAIAAAGSVFTRFVELCSGAETSKTAGYILDMLFIALLFTCFRSAVQMAEEYLMRITEFMKALVPAYCTAMAVSGKVSTAAFSSQVLLFAAALVEWVCLRILLPLTEVYLILSFLNRLTAESLFDHMKELLQSGIGWVMKALSGVLLGLQIVQGLVLPAADSGKYRLGERLLGLIPGLGSGAQVVVNTAIGSGILMKNCIGGAGMLAIAFLTVVPCCKLALLAAGYQLTAAVIQPVGNAAMSGMASGTASAVGMLAKMVAFGGFLFFLSLAAMSAATGIAVSG